MRRVRAVDGVDLEIAHGETVAPAGPRLAQLGTAVSEGHAPATGAIIVLAAWLMLFGSYAALSYRRRAGTI